MRQAVPLLALLGLTALLASGAARAGIDWADGTLSPSNPGADLGSASYSTWSLAGTRVTARFLVPIADAQRIAGSDIEVLVQQRMGDYLLAHLAVRAGTKPCEPIDQGYDIGRIDPLTVAAGLYGFEIFFQCADPGSVLPADGVVLEDHALFDRLPGQVDFARLQTGNGAFRQQLFTRTHQQLLLAAQGPPASVGLTRLVGLGVARLLGRWDHLCFLLAALLLTRRTRELLALWAGLSFGYALSLPVALAGGLVPRGALLGAALGLLIALLAAQRMNCGLARARSAAFAGATAAALLALATLALLAHARWPVLLLAGSALFAGGLLSARDALSRSALNVALLPAVFGFLNGFVLPAALAPEQLQGGALAPMVLSYDVGSLLAAMGVLALLALVRAASTHWRAPAPLATSRALAADGMSALLAGLGVFWMLSRLHG
jgi:hypothetical protein